MNTLPNKGARENAPTGPTVINLKSIWSKVTDTYEIHQLVGTGSYGEVVQA